MSIVSTLRSSVVLPCLACLLFASPTLGATQQDAANAKTAANGALSSATWETHSAIDEEYYVNLSRIAVEDYIDIAASAGWDPLTTQEHADFANGVGYHNAANTKIAGALTLINEGQTLMAAGWAALVSADYNLAVTKYDAAKVKFNAAEAKGLAAYSLLEGAFAIFELLPQFI